MPGTLIGVGASRHRNPSLAAKEAVAQAKVRGSILRPDFVLMFAMVGYRQDVLLKTVRAETDQAPLVGCSGAGIIATGIADESNFGLVIMLMQSDEIHIQHGMVKNVADASTLAGQVIGQEVRTHLTSDTAAVFLFADGIDFNFYDFLQGMGELSIDGHAIPLLGGLAGDNLAYEKTYQYYNDELLCHGAVWATISGPIRIISAMSHGCVPIGTPRTITKCDGNIIYEVDHQPVLEVLKDYLNDHEIHSWDKAAANLGLAFLSSQTATSRDAYTMRCMIAKNLETNSVMLQTSVKEGDEFWVSRRDFNKILEGNRAMAESITAQLGDDTPQLIFQVECDGRGKTILREQEKLALIETLQSTLGANLPWIGLYAFAEICPIGQNNHIHNLSSIVTAIC